MGSAYSCVDCKKHDECTGSRRGPHTRCFVGKDMTVEDYIRTMLTNKMAKAVDILIRFGECFNPDETCDRCPFDSICVLEADKDSFGYDTALEYLKTIMGNGKEIYL